MVFKADLERLVLSKVGKEQHFTYQSQLALITDLCTALSEVLDERHKEVLEELKGAYNELINLSDSFLFSYTFDYINGIWREVVLNGESGDDSVLFR